jgi:uncharacterized protein YndB with AHSA1/START domain
VIDDPHVLRMERLFDAPPERIFAAWTDPVVLRRWWAAEPGWTTPEATTDVRVGGSYRLSMQDTRGKVRSVAGEYLEVDPPRRLVYTWAWEAHADAEQPGEPTIVTVEFVPEGSSTRVVLEQRRFPEASQKAMHEHGWRGCLDSLERALSAVSVGPERAEA